MLVKSLQATEHRGIEANSVKVTALLEMRSPQKPKKVQRKKFQWTSECEEAFQALKKHLGEAPLLSKPQSDESLLLYLAVSNVVVSTVLIRKENENQLPVYYISKGLLSAKTHYPDMKKLAVALITTSRKLRPYFQAHSIQVLTNFPLKQVMQKTDASGRLLKWAIELSEFDLTFQPRHAIKGQALADFMVEFTKALEMEAIMEPAEPPTWKLFIDGSSGEAGAGTGIVLESPEGHKLNCTVRFSFKVSNNAAEYEALLAGLRLAKEMWVRKLLASSDSQLIVNQINGNFAAKDDALSKLASSMDLELLNIIPIEHLSKSSTSEGEEVLWIEGTPLWMQPIIVYLKEQTLPASRGETKKLRRRATHFVLQEDTLYKRGFASSLLRCVDGEEATYILREIHEGICGNHSRGTALGHKVLRQGRGSSTFVIVAIDYFTKWVEAEPLARITEANTIKTTCWTATGETPFSMIYGAEAMSPVEVGVPSHRRIHFNEIGNDEARMSELHLLEEKRDTSQVTLARQNPLPELPRLILSSSFGKISFVDSASPTP
ncbi:uncharacterized protein LOC111381267 [Olea europaea var. sylvestris]|uniref:uncharacterized protein LOC111381267 n=1 Tax=Olea europaea var. sylvestris TaxID=158386 RepID=UPI000C1D47AB|nr:uncharacterized protein LOC111381267 [Olea europaea var. sylvestris]